ncbi:MAG TPA: hypothetical protein DCZ92_03755 [Elusimicrobia bacterium]|nr:MAG: hypothetical protein A2016_01350 [Elusimicrobia bacterium GWF2_62_30]HBA59933.1 hypothetical protein [Elusimicrobiota bacterium]
MSSKSRGGISPGSGEKEHNDRTFDGLALKGKAVTSKHFSGCVFRNCDLTGLTFRFCKFTDCRFESCNLSLLKVPGTVFSGVSFKDSKLVGVDWTQASWPKIKLAAPLAFAGCLLNDSNFLGLALAGTAMTGCLARDADLREADLAGSDLTKTDFSGALFSNTNLAGADLTGARNYAIRISENKVKDAKFSLPEAMDLLYCLDIKIV